MLEIVAALLIKYYAVADADLHRWFESLRNTSGGYCCAEADGVKLDDPAWGHDEQGYWVIKNGVKLRVPPNAVLTAKNPQVKWAIVWISAGGTVLCFLPGTEI